MITDKIETERIVVVSSDSAVLRSIWSLGESNSWQLEITANAWEAMDKVQSGLRLGLVLLDLPYGNGGWSAHCALAAPASPWTTNRNDRSPRRRWQEARGNPHGGERLPNQTSG